ncbi:MAG: T9SS type A sorting domain-containing protein [Rhodothermia bacterium]
MLERIGLSKHRASLIVSLCTLSLILLPALSSGQDVAILTFGDGGGKSVGTDFQIETIIGQTFVGSSKGPTRSSDFGFWFAEFALIDPSAVSNESTALPDGIPEFLTLQPNYPNPVSRETNVPFGLPKDANARITLFDMLGRRVRVATNQQRNAGWHLVRIATEDLPSGTYFLQLDTGDDARVRPIIVLH